MNSNNVYVHELFLQLPEEKQEEILQAALKEFAEHGFEMASTNQIVKEAKISKGVLFKYFISKENLFKYVMDWKLKKKFEWMSAGKEELPVEFFDILRWYTLRELAFIKEEPNFYKAMEHVVQKANLPVHQEVVQLANHYSQEISQTLVQELPVDSLRDGVTIQSAFQFISLVFESYKRKFNHLYMLESDDAIVKEVEELFTLIKYGIYK